MPFELISSKYELAHNMLWNLWTWYADDVTFGASWRPEDQLLLFIIPWAMFHSSATAAPPTQSRRRGLLPLKHSHRYQWRLFDKQAVTITSERGHKCRQCPENLLLSKRSDNNCTALIKYESGKYETMIDTICIFYIALCSYVTVYAYTSKSDHLLY